MTYADSDMPSDAAVERALVRMYGQCNFRLDERERMRGVLVAYCGDLQREMGALLHAFQSVSRERDELRAELERLSERKPCK